MIGSIAACLLKSPGVSSPSNSLGIGKRGPASIKAISLGNVKGLLRNPQAHQISVDWAEVCTSFEKGPQGTALTGWRLVATWKDQNSKTQAPKFVVDK